MTQGIIARIYKEDLRKLQSLCTVRETISRVLEPTERDDIFGSYLPDRGLVLRAQTTNTNERIMQSQM